MLSTYTFTLRGHLRRPVRPHLGPILTDSHGKLRTRAEHQNRPLTREDRP
jgi:hypothetical protein